MKRIFISFLCFSFFLNYSVSQSDCQCTRITQQQTDGLISNFDSTAIHQTIRKLRLGGDKTCQVLSYNIEVDYLMAKKNLSAALPAIQKQEKLIFSLPCKKELLIHSYLNYATYNKSTQNYEALSNYAFKALKAAETLKDQQKELKAIALIVFLNTRQNQNEKNWNYVKRAEKIILTLGADYTLATNYNWLAFEYEQEYSTKGRRGLMDSSVMYSAIALKAALKRRDHFEITRCFRVLESNAVSKQDYKSAVRYADSAIFHLKKIRTPMNPAALYVTKALDYADLKNYMEAQRWIDTSIYYAEKMEGKTPATAAVYGQAAQIFEKAGNLPRAIATMKIYNQMKDSVFTQERLVKINELEQKYFREKNENTIKDLASKKQFYLFLAIAGLLGIAAISFFLRQQALTYKKNILEAEQRLNRARMNPHFFFNALTALQKFAVTENNPQAMATNLSRFSNIMRETLESTYKEYVSIEQEMEFLEEYLEVQSIRFSQAFSYQIKADHDLEVDELLIPSMIIQPFVENSIEHGFSGIDYQANIQVEFKKDDKNLLILISDNGQGIRGVPKENHQHVSRASQILKDRIYLLNLKLKTRAGFHIDNDVSGKGVIVKINLPLLYKNQTQS